LNNSLLEVKGLSKYFEIKSGFLGRSKGLVKAVDGIDLYVGVGETVGLVGESGSGKTTTGRTILKLYDPTSGSINFSNQDISQLSHSKMKPLRSQMQMIFQDPFSSLNPRKTVGDIIAAPLEIHKVKTAKSLKSEIQNLLEKVGLNPEHINRFPHEFSGGQRQRIGIARALALKPKLIIADEPVSALDISIQAQIVNLLDDLQDEFKLSYLIIAHDLSVIQHISDRVYVMYLGKIMESSTTEMLFKEPHHPYSKALLSAVPIPDPKLKKSRERIILTGDLPSPSNPPSGCVFRTRCWKAAELCSTKVPELLQVGSSQVACHFPE
jgi:oligopeptide/dipeptide ABC transporter ATP-binding protein